MAAAEPDRDRRVYRGEIEQHPRDRPRRRHVVPFACRTPLFDVERGRRQVGPMVRRLERDRVGEGCGRPLQRPQGGRHPPGRRWDERLRSSSEFRGCRVPDGMDREARAFALGLVLREVHDEIGGLSERAFEIAVEVIAVEMRPIDCCEYEVAKPPRGPSFERRFSAPRRCLEKGLPLASACLVGVGRHQKSHPARERSPPPSRFARPSHKLYVACPGTRPRAHGDRRSEEHTSELQSHHDLVCRLLLEKKKKIKQTLINNKIYKKKYKT